MNEISTPNPQALHQGDTEYALEIEGLRKIYAASGKAEPKVALNGIDLKVKRGSIFGLLGPNGAGKSTTINILAGLVNKSGGKVKIWGFDIDDNPRNAKAHIGIVPQEVYFDPYFTPWEMVDIQAGYFGIKKEDRNTDELLAAVGLTDKADSYARHLSGGMKRRLLMAKAMAHTPPILVLDEPTAGVDVELRQHLWDYVVELNKRGVTIILTTHYLEEAEELCDEIAIISHGELIAHQQTQDLVKQLDEKRVVIQTSAALEALPHAIEEIGAKLSNPHEVVIDYKPSQTTVAQILSLLNEHKIEISDLSTQESDLEDIFLRLTSSK